MGSISSACEPTVANSVPQLIVWFESVASWAPSTSISAR